MEEDILNYSPTVMFRGTLCTRYLHFHVSWVHTVQCELRRLARVLSIARSKSFFLDFCEALLILKLVSRFCF